MALPWEEVLGEEELDMADEALWGLATVLETDGVFLDLWAVRLAFFFGAPFCVFGMLGRESQVRFQGG